MYVCIDTLHVSIHMYLYICIIYIYLHKHMIPFRWYGRDRLHRQLHRDNAGPLKRRSNDNDKPNIDNHTTTTTSNNNIHNTDT